MLYYMYFVTVEYFFLILQIIAESLSSPKFENLLLGDEVCGVFQGGAA